MVNVPGIDEQLAALITGEWFSAGPLIIVPKMGNRAILRELARCFYLQGASAELCLGISSAN